MIHKMRLPRDSKFVVPGRVIHAQIQDAAPRLWYEVGPEREHRIVMTGEEHTPDGEHVGTIVGIDNWFVAHIYDVSQAVASDE